MQHEQTTPTTPSERYSDPCGFTEAATAIVRACAEAGSSLASDQVRSLVLWAKEVGCLLREEDFEALPLVSDETGEHEVRFRAEDGRAVKKTWPGTFGMRAELVDGTWRPGSATPLEYLVRFQMHNALFQDQVRLEGIIDSDKPSMLIGAVGSVSIVVSQPWLVAADSERPHPSPEEIATYMQERAFTELPDAFFGWYRETDQVLLLDAKPDNFIQTPAGPLPFDVVLSRHPMDDDKIPE